VRKLKRTGGPNSKNRGEHSKKKNQETEKKLKTQHYPAHTHAVAGSGSPERFRSVGWIQVHQDRDPMA